MRFRWEFRPGSDLFVVYNEGRDTSLGVSRSELSSRSFVVKVTRLFRVLSGRRHSSLILMFRNQVA